MAKSALERFREVFDPKEIGAATKANSSLQQARDVPGLFTAKWFESMEILEAEQSSPTKARAVYRFPVTAEYLNPAGNLHGGAIATIFDITTSWMMFFVRKEPDFWMSYGVTRSLNITYLRPAPLDAMVLVEAEIVQVGKRMAVVKGVMKLESNGKEVALCEHGKFNSDPDVKI